jgi:ribosome-associated protein
MPEKIVKIKKMRNYENEVLVRTSRSGGKGGQNVNKVETKVELVWQPANTLLLTDAERTLLLEVLADKLDNEGCLHVTAQAKRTQIENKELAYRKLHALVNKALIVAKPRRATKIPKAVKEGILREKAHNADKKANRRRPNLSGDE